MILEKYRNGHVVGKDTMEKLGFVISNAEEGIKKIKKYTEIEITDIVLINSSPNQDDLRK